MKVPASAARCIDCDLPIVNAVADLWGVRLYDDVRDEERN